MVNAVQATSSGVSSAALSARASAASAALTAEPVAVASAAQAAGPSVTALSQAYRYNSFEFSYRQDFGKIVLLRQKPDTGELVQQFPSEYYLRKYADSERIAQVAVEEGKSSGAANSNSSTVSTEGGSTPAPASGSVTADVAPAIVSVPALPSSSGTGGSTSGASGSVDVTV